jgi:dipeptidyl aminopeptidase/acylaminoacyl peptidase
MHEFFPGQYMWSLTALISLGCGGLVDEIDRIAKKLENQYGDNQAWYREWHAMGAHVENLGKEARDRGYKITASNAFSRACNYYLVGERFLPPSDEKKIPSYKQAIQCFNASIETHNGLGLERVEIPYEGVTLPGYFMKPSNASKPGPTIIFIGGLDVMKEQLYLTAAKEIIARGMACLFPDTPGIGETLRLRKIHSRHDYEVAGKAIVDYLETRDDVDPKRIGLMGLSMGGYYAPRIAAFEKRIKACVAWSGHGDYYYLWLERLKKAKGIGEYRPVPNFQILWVLGVETFDEVLEEMKKFSIEKEAKQITCPFLVTHGGGDQQTPPEEAKKLYRAVGSKDKQIKIFSDEEGGNEHCQVDNVELGRSYVLDWFTDKL